MAHYKILTTSVNPDSSFDVQVAAYYPVGPGSNEVGTPWRDAVVGFITFRSRRFGGFGTQASSTVTPATQALLDTGELYEDRFRVLVTAGSTGLEARTQIEAAVTARQVLIVSEIADLLRYWGFEGDSI